MIKFIKSIARQFNIGNIYILAMTTYSFLHITQYDGTPLTRLIILFNAILSAYSFFQITKLHLATTYLRRLFQLFALFFIYGIILILFFDGIASSYGGVNETHWFLMEIFTSLLPIVNIYYLSMKRYFTEGTLQFWLVVFMFMAIPAFWISTNNLVSDRYVSDIANLNRTNNTGYLFLSLLPGIAAFNKRVIVQYVVFIYCFVFMFLCMKRGPIVIGLLCFIFYLFYQFKHISLRKKLIIAILSYATIRIAMIFFMDMADSNAYFLERINDTLNGETSGRDALYSNFIRFYLDDANIIEKIFGIGAYGTLRVGDNFAHNDWVEILICEGILGVIIYVRYWLSLFREGRSNKAYPSIYIAIVFFFIIYFMKTMFSMSYNDIYFESTIFFGYYLAESYKKKNYATQNSIPL